MRKRNDGQTRVTPTWDYLGSATFGLRQFVCVCVKIVVREEKKDFATTTIIALSSCLCLLFGLLLKQKRKTIVRD